MSPSISNSLIVGRVIDTSQIISVNALTDDDGIEVLTDDDGIEVLTTDN